MMLSARWYKIINDLWCNKLRTVLIVLSIAIGLFGVGTIVSTRSILSSEMARAFAAANPSHGIITTLEPFEQDFVQVIKNMPQVADVDARRMLEVRADVGNGERITLRLFAVQDFDHMRVDIVRPISGEWPPEEGEILLERSAIPLMNAVVGDTISVETSSEQKRDLYLTGVAHDIVQIPAHFDSTPYGYIHMDTVTWLGEPYGLNELHIIAAEEACNSIIQPGTDPGQIGLSCPTTDEAKARQVINEVKAKAEKSGLTIPISLSAQPGQLPLDDILQAILTLMAVLGVLSLGLSAFLIINTVTALLGQQKRQIGVMKALGASSNQLLGMYLIMVIGYGLMALLLAIPLSITGARGLSSFLAGLFNFDLGEVAAPGKSVILQVVIGLLVPVLASLYPFLSNLRVPAAEVIHDFGTAGSGNKLGWFDRLLSGRNLWFARRRPARSWLLSLRNTFRRRGRLVLTLLTLTMAGAIFISVFSIEASLENTLDDMLGWWQFDTMVSLERPYRTKRLAQKAAEVIGVEATEGWLQFPAYRRRPDGSEGDVIMLFAIEPDSRLTPSPPVVVGRSLKADDESVIVLNSIVRRKEPDVGLGDEIILKVDGRERPFTVIGFCYGVMFPMAYAPYDAVSYISNDRGLATTALIKLVPPDEDLTDLPGYVNATTELLEKHFKRSGIPVSSIQTILEERAEAESSFNIIITLLLLMAGLLALVGGLGLMGTMSINVLERTREIGILRAIGARNRGVSAVFIREGVAIGLLSWLLALPFAFPLGRFLSHIVGIPLTGSSLIYSYSYTGVWMWLILVVFLSALASFVPARNASRLTVREVLAYE
jgi:putative ABC transport system permease protein